MSNSLKSLFEDVFESASLQQVEVEQCVSLQDLRVRPLHIFGIKRAIHLLQGESIGSVTGHVCVGKFPVIVKLPVEYRSEVIEYFVRKGRDRELSERFVSSRGIYHVVNGGYEHAGRWHLIDIGGYQFTGVKWRTIQIPWQDPTTLRAIALMSNQVQKQEHIVQLSFFDEMIHLRRIIDDYLQENGTIITPGQQLPRGFCKAISRIFHGGKEFSNNTLRHLISISTKMSMRTTVLLRKVIDEECPALAKTISRRDNSDTPFQVMDTRVFRKLINSKSLRGAKKFLDPSTIDDDRACAMHRLRYVAQENGRYKGVDHSTLDFQVESASLARKVIEEFRKRILQHDEWPEVMMPLLRNMLCTTKLDEEIIGNREKPDELLITLKMKYLACAGAEGGQKVEQYEKFVADKSRHVEALDISRQDHGSEETGNVFITTADVSDETTQGKEKQATETNALGNEEPLNEGLQSDPDVDTVGDDIPVASEGVAHQEVMDVDPLVDFNVTHHCLSWEDYNRSVLNEQEIFDLVISDPFQKAAAGAAPVLDTDRRDNFLQFLKKVLVPGGYVFLIVPQLELSSWMLALEESEFKPECVFTLLKDPDLVQRVRGKSFQNLSEVAAVGRKGGRHPSKFVMDTLSPYTQLPRNRYKRKAPVIDNIAPPSSRLYYPGSKTWLRTSEKSPALFWEIMRTFCPPGGRVLDPFAGTLTTGIAGIQSGRPCVLLETDSRCLSLGVERLRNVARVEIDEALKKATVVGVSDENHRLDANDLNMNELSSHSHETLNVENDIEEQVDLRDGDPGLSYSNGEEQLDVTGGDPGLSYCNEDNHSDNSTLQENSNINGARHHETSEPKRKKLKSNKAQNPGAGTSNRSNSTRPNTEAFASKVSRPRRDRKINPRYE